MNSIIILGPTAVGKSKLGIELAQKINGEIISADSMQVYRGMDIGTAKPTFEERQGIPHHLIDIRNPDEEWTVSDFVEQTNQLTNDLINRGKTPIIVGGTGLYLWALLEGFSFPIAPADRELRTRLEKQPTSTLYARLSAIDPKAAIRIHENDKKRIIRALEVYELTGKPISALQARREPEIKISVPSESKARINSRFANLFAGSILIGLTLPREELYLRINQRVDNMLAKGLIDEVKGLLAKGYPKELPSFQALGYKEVIEYLQGHWTKEEMIEELKKRTRNFARKQMTWFRRFKNINWIEVKSELCSLTKLCYNLWHDQNQTTRN
ncbi:MAG: tRNA (adenosine(37)-N6)-dimethylallyltransferase MiaA [Candidatus Margulisiibacteriota bacterium]